MDTLSNRSQKLQKFGFPGLNLDEYYHPEKNPNGVIQLFVADNQLGMDMIEDKIKDFKINSECMQYDVQLGREFKKVMSQYLEKYVFHSYIDPKYMQLQAGICSTLNSLACYLGESEDLVLTFGPIYPKFNDCFTYMHEMKLEIIYAKGDNDSNDTPYYLLNEPKIDDLIEKYDELIKQNKKPKVLLICNPHNPTGLLYSTKFLTDCIKFCSEKKLHIISDEVFSTTVFPENEFVSVAQILKKMHPDKTNYLGDHVHLIYSTGKTFGTNGLKCAIFVSHNESLLSLLNNSWSYSGVSTLSLELQKYIFSDEEFVANYIKENSDRMLSCYNDIKVMFESIGCKVIPSKATTNIIVDLSKFMKRKDLESERNLLSEIKKLNLFFYSGENISMIDYGYFRVSFSSSYIRETNSYYSFKDFINEIKNRFEKLKDKY